MKERGYNTRQRERILEYLNKAESEHNTVEEIFDYFKSTVNPIGKTTIYRYMDKLVNEGKVRKFFIEDGVSACFQYIGDEKECKNHYHLKCSLCNRLLHLECHIIDELNEHIYEEHLFKIDMSKTVIYGICDSCR